MLNIGITVWSHGLLNSFLEELEAHPQSFEKVALVSPYVNLTEPSAIATRLRDLLSVLVKYEANVGLVSDLTPNRVLSFSEYLASVPRFSGFVGFYPKLHAKCGYGVSRQGAHIAFVGSANLTNAALSRNHEMIVAVKTSPSFPESYKVYNQIKQQTDEILAGAVGPGHISSAHQPKISKELRFTNRSHQSYQS